MAAEVRPPWFIWRWRSHVRARQCRAGGVVNPIVESCPACGRRWYLHRTSCPACGGRTVHRAAADGRGLAAAVTVEAGDLKACVGQLLQAVELLDVAVADLASGAVAFPDDRGVVVEGVALGGVHEGC